MKHATSETINGVETIVGIFAGRQLAFHSFEVPTEVRLGWIKVGDEWQAPPPTPADILAAARASMAAIFDALTDEQKAIFYGPRIIVEGALDRGDVFVARKMVQNVAVPADLQATKQSILDLFPK